jgi:outer membrane protein assembly factor BamD
VETYLTVGLIEEAKKNGAVLGYNFPGDPWYGEAYKLLTSKGLRPAVEPSAKGKRGFLPNPFRKNKGDTVKPPQTVSANSAAAPAAEPKQN